MKNLYFNNSFSKVLFLIIILFPLSYNSQSQVIKDFTQRSSVYTPNQKIYNNLKGDYTMIGNSNIVRNPYSTGIDNNTADMVFVDIDNDPNTINSSSATLQFSTENEALPECSNIVYAGLYWTGRAHSGASPNVFVIGTDKTIRNDSILVGSNPQYQMKITRQGSNPYTVRYTFSPTVAGTGNTVSFDFTSKADNSPDAVMVSINGEPFTNHPCIINTFNANNDRVATFNNPFYIGNFVITGLLRDKRVNLLESSYKTSGRGYITLNPIKTLDKQKVKLKKSGESYITVSASPNNIYFPTNTSGSMYTAYAEITDYIRQHGFGEYFVADMALREGKGDAIGFFGGWAIIVVYENYKMHRRDITIFDGFAYMQGSQTGNHELPVSGFETSVSGDIKMKLGIIAGEGDRNIGGDFFEIRNHQNTNWIRLKHQNNLDTNFFNSSVYTGGNPRNPNRLNNYGMDVIMFEVPNINNTVLTNNQTSTRFRYGSTQDAYTISCIAMSVNANVVPEISAFNAMVSPVGHNSGDPVFPGDTLTFSLEIKNHGTEPVNDLNVEIPVPFNTTFLSSFAEFFNGATGSQPAYDPLAGGSGLITWNATNIPLPPVGQDPVYARLTYKLIVTEDCYILKNALCQSKVIIHGTFNGTGAISGKNLLFKPFNTGFNPAPNCSNEFVTTPLSYPINAGSYLSSHCNEPGWDYSVKPIYFCDVTTTTIPYSQVAFGFPLGSSFFNNIVIDTNTGEAIPSSSAIEYTQATGFPAIIGETTYYAIPPGINNGCYYTFKIIITNVSSVPSTQDVRYCRGTVATPLTATPSQHDYRLFYYQSATGGTPQSSIIPSTNTVGETDYWVAEGPTASCISPNRVKITVQITENTNIIEHPQAATYCPNSTSTPLRVASTGTQPITYQWYKNNNNSNFDGEPIPNATSTIYTPPTNQSNTVYYYVVATGACGTEATNTAAITTNPKVTFSKTGENISCFGETNGKLIVTVNSGIPTYKIELFKDGVSFKTVSNVNSPYTFDGLSDGLYNVIVTDSNGCIGE